VILYTVRDILPSTLLRQPQVLSGKIVIDCNNSEVPSDFRFAAPIPSLAERLAADVPGARVVKAFNTMAAQLIERCGHDYIRCRRDCKACAWSQGR
jgi:8-hydroxy-5-deazaflavin:NADPH oxidoreductase